MLAVPLLCLNMCCVTCAFVVKAAISDFCGVLSRKIFDALAATPQIDFRHSQVAALLYEIAVVRASDGCDGSAFDEALKKYNFSAFIKAFPWAEDLERFLSFRTLYFPLLLTVIKDKILKDPDDDEDDNLDTARNVLHLAVSLMNEHAGIREDMTSLDHYLHLSTTPGSKDVAATGIQEGWSTILQRAAEAETAKVMKPSSRTQSQWKQQEQTVFMSLRSKSIAELRSLANAEVPSQDTAIGISKDTLARSIAASRIATLKAAESEVMHQIDTDPALSTRIADEIKNLNKEPTDQTPAAVVDAAEEGGPLKGTPFRTLESCVSAICAPSGYSAAMQQEILEKCQVLTTHIHGKADIGRDMLLIKAVTPKGFKGLAAFNALPAAEAATRPLRLFLRGTVSPSTGPAVLSASVVMPDVGELTVNGKTVGLSLFMTKDQAQASAWSGSRFCPAMLVDSPKEPKAGPIKGRKVKAADAGPEIPPLTLALTSEEDSVVLSPSSPPVTLKVFSLSGVVPGAAPDTVDAAQIMHLVGPSLKRDRPASDEAAVAKRHRATVLLGAAAAGAAPSTH